MNHYCAYTRDISEGFLQDLDRCDILFELHLNRLRLWLSPERDLVFYLKWGHILRSIDHEQDHALGV